MKRLEQLDGLRAIAILSVFAFHALGTKFLWGGVDLFFIISGFLITDVLLRAKTLPITSYFAHFYERRARRILAPYLLFLFVISLFYGLSWLRHWYLYIFLANFLSFLHVPYPHPVGILWSLAVEEQFYLVWPFAIYFLSQRHLRWLCIALIAFAPLLRGFVHVSDPGYVYELTPFRMDLLATGGLLSLVWRARREWIQKAGPVVGPFFVLAGAAGLIFLQHKGISDSSGAPVGLVLTFEFSLIMWLGVMVYALSGWHVGWLRMAWLRYVGRISYSMYLIHFLVLAKLRDGHHHNQYRVAAAALAITLVYASLSWFLMEKPLLTRAAHGKEPIKTPTVREAIAS